MARRTLFFLAALVPLVAHAAPPFITYSGRLTDGTAASQSTTLSLSFALYAQAEGGAALWTSPAMPVAVEDGYFSVILGNDANGVAVTTVFATHDATWLGVTAGAGPEMAPRQAIGSVPYAARCSSASAVGANDLVAIDGKIGIGTSDPGKKLDVAGDARVSGTLFAGCTTVTGAKSPTATGWVTATAACASGIVVGGGGQCTEKGASLETTAPVGASSWEVQYTRSTSTACWAYAICCRFGN